MLQERSEEIINIFKSGNTTMGNEEKTQKSSEKFNKSNIPVFSKIEQIQSLLAKKMIDVNRFGIMVSLKQEIPYGTQLNLEGQGTDGLINIYYSKKKGLSFVDCSKNDTSVNAINILQGGKGNSNIGKKEKELDKWIGTDESGKGDFFGPLVIAGFYITREIENDVIALGVMDSKKLTSDKIRAIAGKLWGKYDEHISVVAPSNIKYNQLYEKFKNLNKLLAWGHARVIDNLVTKWQKKDTKVDNVVSDQFGNESLIKNALRSMKGLNIIQRPRGESNTAVAAASIIARDSFEKHVRKIEKEYATKVPFGAGANVLEAAKRYAQKNGKEKLKEITKYHFKTFAQI